MLASCPYLTGVLCRHHSTHAVVPHVIHHGQSTAVKVVGGAGLGIFLLALVIIVAVGFRQPE